MYTDMIHVHIITRQPIDKTKIQNYTGSLHRLGRHDCKIKIQRARLVDLTAMLLIKKKFEAEIIYK